MTNLDVVINAITTGAGLVASGVATVAAEQAYQTLKGRIRPHLSGNAVALAELDSAVPRPDVLRDHLARAVDDPGVVGAATQVFHIVDSPGSVIGPNAPVTVTNNNYFNREKPHPQRPAAV